MSFINPIFLIATAAALLPVLYHLVRRMKVKTVPFSTLMFLKATPKELIKRRRLKDRLLMAARCAIFLLLAIVFARPYLPAEHLPFAPADEARSTVILVDRSFSMQHGAAFERALEAVRNRLDAARSGDEVALVAFDEAPQLLAPLESDLAAHRGALNALKPGYRTTDYYPALQRAQDLLRDARHERREVVLISDFQAAGWTSTLEDWKLDQGIEFEPVSIAPDNPANGYVEAFEASGRRSEGRYAMRFDARVALTEDADQDRGAALILDGAEIDRRTLPARTSAPLSFQHLIERDGFIQGELVLDPDDLPVDDRYYFTEAVSAAPGLLVIDAPAGDLPRDAFYLRSAFDLGEASLYRMETGERITESALRPYDVVFLANRTPAPAGERDALRGFAEDGGTLILSPGDATSAAAFSTLAQDLGLGTIPRIVDAREDQGYEAIVGEVDLRHPIFAPFAGGAAILQPKFRQYARLEAAAGTNVIGRFDSGDPFLAERTLGRGRVLLYASTFNTAWTDMPLDEMFVPFVYQLARYGTQRRDAEFVYVVGESVELVGRPEETWEVRTPEGRVHRVALDGEGRGVFRETEVPGHYTAAAGLQRRMFSVNVDPRESELAARDPDEVYASVAPPPDDAPTTPEQAAASVVVDEEKKQKLWKLLLMLVIGLFAVETFFANRRRQSDAGSGSRAGERITPSRSKRQRGEPGKQSA